jgi:23S rRNA (cytosine1962-C5)-methyltransferase
MDHGWTSFCLAHRFDAVGRVVSRKDVLVEGYQLVDVGDGRRLERFGDHLVDRPQPGAVERRAAPERWPEADLRYDRVGGWTGAGVVAARHGWSVDLQGLSFELRPTDAGQVGLFPEHAALLSWLTTRLAERGSEPSVLNVFASTGLVTVALARAGASVAHVDAAKSAVDWARRNAALNGVADRPIRWLIDDVRAFVAREVRRGRRYDGVVLDPPTYGHGISGRSWRLERDLEPLLAEIRLLAPDGFLLLTAHTTDLLPARLGALLGDEADVGDLSLHASSGAELRLGAFARLGRAS